MPSQSHYSPAPSGFTPPPQVSDSSAGGDFATIQATADLIAASLDADKAEDIATIDVRGKSSVADILIVASGRSARHVASLADHVVAKLKERGVSHLQVEGLPQADWVLVDAGDVIVHIFRPEVRAFYNIERIWSGERPSA